ncbi:MAG: hypothetical protein EOM20_19835 [Spartobacteria bacterium]|nr:hypothetical protein [Spartobacteria bacterium]
MAVTNASAGLYINGYDNVADNNQMIDNDWGIQTYASATGNLITRNRASRNTSNNFEIAAGNRDAQVLPPGTGFVSTDPWANFAY